jgi:hypothetical protein
MPAPRKLNKRPCSVCRRWFLPDPRVAHCQKTCGSACRKALAAKRDAKWRAKNPDYEEHRRLVAALDVAGAAGIEIEPATSPLAKVPWRAVQVALGGKTAVVLAFALRLHAARCQVAFEGKTRILTRVSARLPPVFDQVAIGPTP